MTPRALAALALLGLAACGGSGGTTTVEVTTTVRETTTVEAVPTLDQTTTLEAMLPGQDLDDADGPLDLRELDAVRFDDLLTVNLTMWEPWDPEILTGPSTLVPGPNELTILYDVDLDGEADYRGRFLVGDEAPVLAISGEGQAFEPVPILNRPAPETVEVTHPVDVFFVVAGEGEPESAVDIQVAATSVFEGAEDRVPDRGWILVPFQP